MDDNKQTNERKASKEIKDAVLNELMGRSGFDDWFEQLDYDIQAEIGYALVYVIEEKLLVASFGLAID